MPQLLKYLQLFIFLNTVLLAQLCAQITFNKMHNLHSNAENATGVVALADCTFAGYTISSGFIFSKLNQYGDTTFIKTYEIPFHTFANTRTGSFQSVKSGGFVVTTTMTDTLGISKMFFIRFANNGDTLFTTAFTLGPGIDVDGNNMAQLADGGFVLVGDAEGPGISQTDLVLVKLDSLGNLLWYKTYAHNGWYLGLTVEETPDKGFIIGTGIYLSAVTRPWVLKTDSVGTLEWRKSYGPTGGDHGGCYVSCSSDSNYFMAGGAVSFTGTGMDAYLAKLDGAGTIIWDTIIQEFGVNGLSTKAVELENGSIIVGGDDFSAFVPQIRKFSSNGKLIWQREVYAPIPFGQNCWDLRSCPDGGIVFCGSGFGTTGSQDSWFVKLDSMGCLIPGCEVGRIPELQSETDYHIYPNPATTWIGVSNEFAGEIILYNSLGQMMLQKIIGTDEKINLIELPNGLYSYALRSINNYSMQKKFKTSYGKLIIH